jgi:glycosyltransferase involved in cell wall biosynthesis
MSDPAIPSIAFIILVRNEEINLATCLESFRSIDAEIFVIDSGSTDRSQEIALRYGATVLEHPFRNYSDQFNWALDHIPAKAHWIFRLDADEFLTPDLQKEIREKLSTLGPSVTGVLLKRRFHFFGRWIRHGGMYPLWHLRLFRRGFGRCEERWMDEHIVVSEGELVRFSFDFVDNNLKDLEFWTQKHNWYSSREILDMEVAEASHFSHQELAAQARVKRWRKEAIYAKMPRFQRAFLYWFVRYFVLLGFLDGREGLIFHFLQAFWYRFLVDAKLEERERKRRESAFRPN